MELQILYNLKDRLTNAAVGGIGALAEDVRLERAVDAFAAAATTAAERRLSLMLRALRASSDAERPARVLDVLNQLDALLCDRAETGVPGELTPLAPAEGGYVEAPFGSFQPLLAALDGSGSGRITVIEEFWAAHPDYFGDTRVLPHLVSALDEAPNELETLLGSILSSLGSRAVPSLKSGAAGVHAERYIYAVARIAGAAENDWYLYLLPRSAKEAREAVIAALSLAPENAPLLAELYRNEPDHSCRDAALRALSHMKDAESRALWIAELERRTDCPSCLEGVDSALAADMAALALRDAVEVTLGLDKTALSRAELLTLSHALSAAYGKYSESMRETWLWCASQLDALERLVPDETVSQWDLSAAEMLEKCLLETVLWNPCDGVRALAQELGERFPARFLSAAALIELILHPKTAFDRYGKKIVKNTLLHRETAAERAARIQLMHALAAVRFDPDHGRHIPFAQKDSLTGVPEALRYRLAEFDPRWAETLGDARVNNDGTVYDLAAPWSMTKLMFQMAWIE